MSEPSGPGHGWKHATLATIRFLLRPLLFFLAGIALIVVLGLAQRYGWITAGEGGHGSQSVAPAASEKSGTKYICPMMCTPPLDQPGRCPVCGMELVPASSDGSSNDGRSIVVDPATRRIANIRTVAVKSIAATRRVRAVGQIRYDEGRVKTLAAYVDGRLDRLFVDFTGALVNQGDELALLYSPELYTAQSELFAAKRVADRSSDESNSGPLDLQDLYASARQKLIDLGMTAQQVTELESSGQPETRIRLLAPIHGTVVEKLASEGQYVRTGQAIYRLADLSTVWLMLESFPEDAAAIRYGQRVQAEVQSLPGTKFEGRVAFIDPAVQSDTRTINVRVVIPNESQLLKIGDYVVAKIDVPLGDPRDANRPIYDPDLAGKWISPRHPHVVEDHAGNCPICGIELVPASEFGFTDQPLKEQQQLVVPRSAVLMAGSHSVVYVETEPGRFELRRVELGPILDDQIVLLGGVTTGEQVAVSGNFLIDSQMQLAGNPSLIDPVKADTQTASPSVAKKDKIAAALAGLSEEDRTLAQKQRVCPVTEMPLGSMGTPLKVEVNGKTVFICCEGCRGPLMQEPAKYLAKLETRDSAPSAETPTPSLAPPIGEMEIIDSAVAPPISTIEIIDPADAGPGELQEVEP